MSGHFDLQINGYAGVDFNSSTLSSEDLRAACIRLKQDRVDGILLTLITDSIASLQRKIQNIVSCCQHDPLIGEMVQGLHIEGPFINPTPGFVGAHSPLHAQKTDLGSMETLLEAGNGMIRLVTLAPEMDPHLQLTRHLADQGIIVAAGHSDASLNQLKAGIDAGLSLFTHLGNGCANLLDRHDNIISRTLSLSDQLWISFIADGMHIPFFVLKNYLKIAGLEKVVIVSDAISAAAMAPGTYTIGERAVRVGEDGVPRCATGNHFVGSGTSLPQMAQNLKDHLGFTEAQAALVTERNPRTLLSKTSHLQPG